MYFKINQVILVRSERDQQDSLELQEEVCTAKSQERDLNSSCTLFSARNFSEAVKTTCIIDPEGCPFNYINDKLKDISKINPDVPTVIDLGSDCSCAGNVGVCKCKVTYRQQRSRSAEPSSSHGAVPKNKKFADILNKKKKTATKVPPASKLTKSEDSKDSSSKASGSIKWESFYDISSEEGTSKVKSKVPFSDYYKGRPKTANIVPKGKNTAKTISADTFISKSPFPGTSKFQQNKSTISFSDDIQVPREKKIKIRNKSSGVSFSSSEEIESDLGTIKWKERIGFVKPKDSFIVAKERGRRRLSIDSDSTVQLFQQSEREVIFPSKFTLKTGSYESVFSPKVSAENILKGEELFDKESDKVFEESNTYESVDLSNICVNSRKIVKAIILEGNKVQKSSEIEPKRKLEIPEKPASAHIFLDAKNLTRQKSKDTNSVKHIVHKVKVPNKVKKSASLKSNPFSVHERHKVKEPTKRKDDTPSFRSKETLQHKRPESKKKVPRYNVKPHFNKASERKLDENKHSKKNIAIKLKPEKSSEKRDICDEDTCEYLNAVVKKNPSEISKNIKSKSSTSNSNVLNTKRFRANSKKKTITDNIVKKRKAVSKKSSCRSLTNPHKNKYNQTAPKKHRSDLRKEKFIQVNEKKSVGIQKTEVKPEYCQTCICTCQLLGNHPKRKYKYGKKVSKTIIDLDKSSDHTVNTILPPGIKCCEYTKNKICNANKTENIVKNTYPFSLKPGTQKSPEKHLNKGCNPDFQKSGREFNELPKLARITQTRNIENRQTSGNRYKLESSVKSRESERNPCNIRHRKVVNTASKTELKGENKEAGGRRYKFEPTVKSRESEGNSNNLRSKKGRNSASKSELRCENKEAIGKRYRFECPGKPPEFETNSNNLRSRKGGNSSSKSELKGENKRASSKKYKFESLKSRESERSSGSDKTTNNLRSKKGGKFSGSKSVLKGKSQEEIEPEICKCCSSESNRINKSVQSLVKFLTKVKDITLKSSENPCEERSFHKTEGESGTSESNSSGSKNSTRSDKSTNTLRKGINGRKTTKSKKVTNKYSEKRLNFRDDISGNPRKKNKNKDRQGKKNPKDSLENIPDNQEETPKYNDARKLRDRENIRSAPCSLSYIDTIHQNSQTAAVSSNNRTCNKVEPVEQKKRKRVCLVSPGAQERSRRKKAGEHHNANKIPKLNISNSTLYCRVNNSPLNLEESFHKDFYRPTWNAILRCSTKFPESYKKAGFVHFSDSVSDPNISRRVFSPTIESISNSERYRSKPLLSQKILKILRKYEKGLSRKSALKLHVSGYCRCDSDCECHCEDWSSSSSNNIEEEMNNRYVYPTWTPPEPGPGLKNYHSRISNFVYSNSSQCPCSEIKIPKDDPMAEKNSLKFCETCSVKEMRKEPYCKVEQYAMRKTSKLKTGDIGARGSESNDNKSQKKVYFEDVFNKPPSPSTRPQNQRLSFLDDPPYCNMENFLSDVNFKRMKLLYRIRNESNREVSKKTNDTEHYCRYSLPRWVNKDRDDR